MALGAEAGQANLTEEIKAGGFSQDRRAAETPLNMVLEAWHRVCSTITLTALSLLLAHRHSAALTRLCLKLRDERTSRGHRVFGSDRPVTSVCRDFSAVSASNDGVLKADTCDRLR